MPRSGIFRKDPLADPERLIRRVYAYVAYRIGDGPDAEDVTSETFERALRYRESYDAAKGEPVAWLLGIARRVIDDAVKVPRTTVSTPDAAAPADLEEETVRRLGLAAMISELNGHDRELIALRYGADLSARQIANLLDMRTNTVEVGLHRALGRLRARLEEEGVEDTAHPAVKASGKAVRM